MRRTKDFDVRFKNGVLSIVARSTGLESSINVPLGIVDDVVAVLKEKPVEPPKPKQAEPKQAEPIAAEPEKKTTTRKRKTTKNESI